MRCRVCIYPDTKRDIRAFEDGVCPACRSFEDRKYADWDGLEQKFRSMLLACDGPYNCIVPASGGKDSTWQVLKVLECGAKPLVVVCATDYLSDIGRLNIENLKRLADVVEVTANLEVRKKLVRIGLEQIGDMSYPEHRIIWSSPLREAIQRDIKLILWGEQPQDEYGSPTVEIPTQLDPTWIAEHGGENGLRIADCVGLEGLTGRDLAVFKCPTQQEYARAELNSTWMGLFFPWDGWKNAFVAEQYGFQVRPSPVEQSLANYENVDNYVTVLRDHLRFVKYGYSRAVDIACNHIRRGRLTRAEGLELVRQRERFPKTSLGKPIDEVLAYFDLTEEQYVAMCDRWTNQTLFAVDSSGNLSKDRDGTPVPATPDFYS